MKCRSTGASVTMNNIYLKITADKHALFLMKILLKLFDNTGFHRSDQFIIDSP